jgi:tripartite-type tricarboxylate transporter receptor subunit TctC
MRWCASEDRIFNRLIVEWNAMHVKVDQRCLTWVIRSLLFLLAALFFSFDAQAQSPSDYPVRPITLVVPFSAGGPVDLIARTAADALSEEIKQTVVVENKPGAGGAIAFSYVAHAKRDGYTLVSVDMSFAVLAHFQSHTGFDPLKDFKMIGQTTRSTLVLVVPADSKTGDLASFIANARKSGHDVSLATAGPGSTPHLAALSFSKAAKIDPLMVPYRGMTPAVTDLLGGRVTGAFVGPQSAVGLVKEKKLKMLAAIGQERLEMAKDVPTFAEKGLDLPGFRQGTWYGLAAPAGTPDAIINKLNTALNRALQKPEVQKRLEPLGISVATTTPAAFQSFIHDQVLNWNEIASKVD